MLADFAVVSAENTAMLSVINNSIQEDRRIMRYTWHTVMEKLLVTREGSNMADGNSLSVFFFTTHTVGPHSGN